MLCKEMHLFLTLTIDLQTLTWKSWQNTVSWFIFIKGDRSGSQSLSLAVCLSLLTCSRMGNTPKQAHIICGWLLMIHDRLGSKLNFPLLGGQNCSKHRDKTAWESNKSLFSHLWWPLWWAQQHCGSPPPADESRWTVPWQSPPWTHGSPRLALCQNVDQKRGQNPGEENFFLGQSGPVWKGEKTNVDDREGKISQ